jgi:hypothetical protein
MHALDFIWMWPRLLDFFLLSGYLMFWDEDFGAGIANEFIFNATVLVHSRKRMVAVEGRGRNFPIA